jgi:hypothetical protein
MFLYNEINEEWNEYWINNLLEIFNISKIQNWGWITLNKNVTWKMIQENPDQPWMYYILSNNPNITWI